MKNSLLNLLSRISGNFAVFLLFLFMCLVVFGILPHRADADNCGVPSGVISSRPDPKGIPTKVSVGIFIIDITDINDVSQSFTSDISLSLRWRDPRLSSEVLGHSLDGCLIRISEIWSPRVGIINQRDVKKRLEDIVQIDDKGSVFYRQRFFGDMSSSFNLKDFPFDKQVLPITVASVYSPEEVEFSIDEKWSGTLDKFSVSGWSIDLNEALTTTEYIAPQQRNLSVVEFRLSGSRFSGFYVWKVLVPLTLIIFMAGTVFLIFPAELGPRVGVSTASVLTLIAFQFTFRYYLPRVSYLTRVDQFVLGASLLVFLALGEAILTSRLAKSGNEQLALKINRWSRYIYPVLFSGLVVVTLFL